MQNQQYGTKTVTIPEDCMRAAAAAGQILRGDPSQEPTPLTQAISSLISLSNHASEIRHSLGNLADRVGGPVPTAAADGSVGKISDHSQMDALHGVLSQLGSALDHIAAEAARLNRLVG